MRLSVLLPTHNPDANRLAETLNGLRAQSLDDHTQWELLLIDNASTNDVLDSVDLSWHQSARVVREEELGLTSARCRGFREAKGEIIIMVDDDNVLAPDYLSEALKLMGQDRYLGAIGGKSIGRFEVEPAPWVHQFADMLALRDFGNNVHLFRWNNGARDYPREAPIGAGMVLRREVGAAYLNLLEKRARSGSGTIVTDRKGGSLASGGDNEIVLVALAEGFAVGYFPSLSLEHIIPAGRCEEEYLSRLMCEANRSWIRVLDLHGIRPRKAVSPLLAPMMKARMWWRLKAWRKPVPHIRWRQYCGEVDGRAELSR